MVYPNPSSGKYSLEFIGFDRKDIQLRILAMDGRELLLKSLLDVSTETIEVDLRDYSDGIYHMVIKTPDNLIWRKLIKTSR